MVRVAAGLLGIALFLVAASWAQSGQDQHMTGDSVGLLCSHSAYIHGYLHGYESGFRAGDLDIHLNRSPRSMAEIKEFRREAGYRREFGNRSYFHLGYQEGFRAAYQDAWDGRAFRGFAQARRAADGYIDPAVQAGFDRAIADGYHAGYVDGSSEPRPVADFQSTAESCLNQRRNPRYCDAFTRGFQIGYSDGFLMQSPRGPQAAQAIGR
jgi:hypothetical protein